MPLESGQTIAHYRLIEKIGEGGMGVVWKAVDTTLDREVAIKVLPEAVAANQERLARFEREAKTLAAFNHPNIATIHGLHADGGRVFLAMELVSGEDLAQRMSRGPIPMDQALPIARKIAQALATAHEQDLVHRDVKPANVVRAADGTVKLLDFGLAKILTGEGAGDEADPAHSPTMTSLGTRAGMILGTAAYMSPEQARGQEVDRRADVWAFGVVLWEMLSGKRLFDGGTISDTLAAVLRADIDLDALPPTAPASIRRLLRRCLARDPEKRLRDLGDAVLDIDDAIAGDGDDGAATAVDTPAGAPAGRGRLFLWLLGTAAVAVAATFLITAALQGSVAPPPVHRLAIARSGFHAGSPVAISPDGSRIAYSQAVEVGRSSISVRDLDSFASRVVSGQDGGANPFFSPDGMWLAYATMDGLSRVALDGGVPEAVTASGAWDITGAWLDENTMVLARARDEDRIYSGLVTLAIDSGKTTILTELATGERMHSRPHVLPDGAGVLFKVDRATDYAIAHVGPDGGAHQLLIDDATTPQYIPQTGHLLFFRPSTENVLAVAFDPKHAELLGTPVEVVRGVLTNIEGSGSYAVANDGTLIYTSSDQTDPMQGSYDVVNVGRDGAAQIMVQEQASWAQPRLSPDGTRLLLRRTATPNCDLWMYDVERGALSRVTFSGDNHDPIWHPSGEMVTFATEDVERQSIVSRRADGTGENVLVTAAEYRRRPWSYSADGRLLAFMERHDTTDLDIWVLDTETGEETVFLNTEFEERMPTLSADGRWMAYVSDESGKGEVYLRPYPGPGGRTQLSNGGGRDPVWSRDGRELYYTQVNQLMRVKIDLAGDRARAGVPEKVLDGPYVWSRPGNFDVAPGDRGFVMVQGTTDMVGTDLRIVLNWFQELERVAPL